MFAYPTATRLALVAAFSLALALPISVVPTAAQQPSPAALATAKEIVTVKGADAFWRPIVRGVVERAKGMFMQSNPMLGKDLNEVAAKLHAEYDSRANELLNDAAKVYTSRFTEQELKDLLAFYKSPLGKKVLAQDPAILEQNMKDAQVWADKLSNEIISKMRAEMRKRGHEI
jgi:uncharacterized protein